MPRASSQSTATRAGHWAVIALAIVLAIIGLILLGGGVYLVVLGGSWYYAIAGLLLLASGVLLFRFERAGALVYAAAWAFTLAWTIWEVQFDWWAWVPRMVAPTVLLVLVLLALPARRARMSQAA